jgi:acid phosphatase
MDPKVPYQPMAGGGNPVMSWGTNVFLKMYYDSGVHMVPQHVMDWMRRKDNAGVEGTPGPPQPDVPGGYRLAVIGDMGEGSPAETRVAKLIEAWGPQHVATVGDNVYPMGREKDWAHRFDPQYEQLRRTAPFHPTLGNHDYYSGDLTAYFQRFPELHGNAWYTWNLGPAQFFVLDTEQRLDGASAQHAWLAAELAKSTAPYKVLQMHRPMVSSRAGSIGRNIHGSLGPLLAKYGVQLVLAGHEHGYERSTDVNGTVFMVTGGGGAASYAYPGAQPPTSAVRTARHHHLQITFDAAKMVVRAVDDKGVTIDTSLVLPRGAIASAAAGAAAIAA